MESIRRILVQVVLAVSGVLPRCALCLEAKPLDLSQKVVTIESLAPFAPCLATLYGNVDGELVDAGQLTLRQILRIRSSGGIREVYRAKKTANEFLFPYGLLLGMTSEQIELYEARGLKPSQTPAMKRYRYLKVSSKEREHRLMVDRIRKHVAKLDHEALTLEDVFSYYKGEANQPSFQRAVQSFSVNGPALERTNVTPKDPLPRRSTPWAMSAKLRELFPVLARYVDSGERLDPDLPIWRIFENAKMLSQLHSQNVFTFRDLLYRWKSLNMGPTGLFTTHGRQSLTINHLIGIDDPLKEITPLSLSEELLDFIYQAIHFKPALEPCPVFSEATQDQS